MMNHGEPLREDVNADADARVEPLDPEAPSMSVTDPSKSNDVLSSVSVDLVGGGEIGGGRVYGPAIGHNSGIVTTTYHLQEQQYDVRGLPNPYLGLRSFTYNDRERYAGRLTLVKEAVHMLTLPGVQRSLFVITGASGSGKSSFVQASLVPALESHYRERNHNVRSAVFRPSLFPISGLLDALAQLDPFAADHQSAPIAQHVDSLLRVLLYSTPPQQINVLVIDQIEELFTQSDATQRDVLLHLLCTWPSFAETRTHTILTLRSDYLPELFKRARLYDVIKQGMDLREMDVHELKQAIQRPLQHLLATRSLPEEHKRFEDALLHRLAEDTTQDATYLALLQVTLEDLWTQGTLKLSAYESLGTAIRRRAEEVFYYADAIRQRTRTDAERAEIMHIFLDLVEVSLDHDARRDVRRRRTFDELVHGSSTRVRLIEDLSNGRLLSRSVEKRDNVAINVVDIIHESLIRNWDRLADAIMTQRQTLQRRVRFEQALHEWQLQDQADDYLLSGVRLAEAQSLAERDDVALHDEAGGAFLHASIVKREADRRRELEQAQQRAEEQARAARNFKRLARVLGVIVLLGIGAAGLAANRANEANQQRATAEAQRAAAVNAQSTAEAETGRAQQQERIAYARQVVLESQAVRDTLPQRSLLLAIEAYRTTEDAAQPAIPVVEDELRRGIDSMSGDTLPGHTGQGRYVLMSADNHWLVTADGSGTVQLWDLTAPDPSTTGRALLPQLSSTFYQIAISGDSHWLLTGGNSGTIRLWDLTAPDPSTTGRPLPDHGKGISAAAMSADNHWLVTGDDDGQVQLWDLTAPDPSATAHELPGHVAGITAMTISADSHRLVTADFDGTARLWDLTGGDVETPVRVLRGLEGRIEAMAISADRQWLVMGSTGNVAEGPEYWENIAGTLRLWDVAATDQSASWHELPGHKTSITTMALSADNHWLVTGDDDGQVRLWDLTADDPTTTMRELPGLAKGVFEMALSADNHWLVTRDYDGQVRLWDLTADDPTTTMRELPGHAKGVFEMAVSADNHWLVTGDSNGRVRLWDLTAHDPTTTVRELPDHVAGLTAMAVSAGSHWLVTGDDSGRVLLWDLTAHDQPTMVRELPLEQDSLFTVAISDDGRWLVTEISDEGVWLWDLTAHDPRTAGHKLSEGWMGLSEVLISADSHWLLTQEQTIELYDLTAVDPISATGELLGQEQQIVAVAISADSHWLVTGDIDGTVRIWDLMEHNLASTARVFERPSEPIVATVISSNNHWLVTGGARGTVRLWTLNSSELIRKACIDAGRNLTATEWRRYMGELSYRKTCPKFPSGVGVR